MEQDIEIQNLVLIAEFRFLTISASILFLKEVCSQQVHKDISKVLLEMSTEISEIRSEM